MGELATSRSLGDAEYKAAKQEEFWERKFEGDLVIAVPEIKEITLGSTSPLPHFECLPELSP